MQTLTFTQKLLRQRGLLSSLIPLFALFLGLGSSLTAMAQAVSTVTASNVSLTISQSGVTSASGNYDTNTAASSTNNFNNKNFGTFNLASDAFVLNGGTISVDEDPSETYDQGELLFRVFPGTLTTGTANTFTRLQLTDGGSVGSVHTFTLSTAARNLLALAVQGSMGGASNRFEVRYVLTDNNLSGNTISTPIRKSVFTSVGSPISPTSAGPPVNAQSTVLINTTGTTSPNTTYTASSFDGTNLGAYDINDGKLTLNGGTLNTFESGGDVVQSARLQYLIVKPPQNSQPGYAFPQSEIALVQNGTGTAGTGGTNRSFSNSTALRNLISGLANRGIGNYTITITYEAVVLRANGTTFRVRDDNSGNGYTATFVTTGIPILIDTWTGGVSDDWFTAANWDLNIVPTSNINVIIPDFGVGNSKPYPNIHAGVTYVYGGNTIDNTNSGDAFSRNVDMQGSSQAQRSLCRIYQGRWKIYGGFSNLYDSFRQFDGSFVEFAGSGNQTITGGSFSDVDLSGAGTKALLGVMNISNSINFLAGSGLLTTDISTPDNNYVILSDRTNTAPNGAQLTGETDSGYIRGFVRTSRSNVLANEVDSNGNPDPRTYGNIGVTLLFGGTNNPGDVIVTRNTSESYTPLVPTSGGTARFGIRRIFGVRPSTTQPLVATMTFRYLDTELTNLGPNGTGSVPEPNLALFVSTSGGNQFGGLGVDALDQTNNILTKSGVRTFATFTLGDKDKPLPVSLTGFDAKRVGNNTLVTWQTATETSNKGYNVQVSTNGKDFRTIGTVLSESPNSNLPKSYSYVDIEENKAGQRYYRLRQFDVDGKETFYTPRVVTFDGKAIQSALTAYPNPFGNADQLHLTLHTAVAGEGLISVTDMTGRLVSQQKVSLTNGSNEVVVDRLSGLKSGIYMVRFILPTGETKNLKVVKQ